ncbi:GNAT family N-acetyltransferase [Streptosporangium lutulentum]|uniref:Phosphinothricin acetyltransferase n=1 Tax=Streptosporangium lutulentum TaxID=1461250 RepID=A0ABT9Q9P2_9ACTN|nr:GNAT family N-acetyltransferase [Streptosporangium lutulentum]MDP9843476.1 phosphinothricin acetyltransferase [Streptosporangium lutulentum]
MTSPHPTIRAAAAEDLQAVARINAHYVANSVATFDETPRAFDDWRRWLEELAERGLPFLVADLAGEVAGYAYAGPWRPKPAYRHTVENTIYIAPGHLGRGLGKALLETLMAESAQAGMRHMIAVIADTGNDASAALHRRFGFTEAGRLTGVGYKHGRWIDTLLMQRPLVG